MKRWLALGLVLCVAWPAVAQTDVPKVLSGIVSKTSGALAVIRYTVQMETGDRKVLGHGASVGLVFRLEPLPPPSRPP